MLTILDISLVAYFGFGAHIPWWLWAWGIVNEFGFGTWQMNVRNAAKKFLKT